MWNRKNPKNVITKVQAQVLYNSMMDMMAKVDVAAPKDVYDSEPLKINYDEPLQYSAPKNTFKSFDYYRLAKKELDTEEDWVKMAEEIRQAANLTPKQKNLLLTTNN
jgi:hypothetical protein